MKKPEKVQSIKPTSKKAKTNSNKGGSKGAGSKNQAMDDMVLVGLGNPGDEYKDTRHNAGRICVHTFAKEILGISESDFVTSKKYNALIAEGSTKKEGNCMMILPETFMNKSGASLSHLSAKKVKEQLVVIHDDMDLPIGTYKIVFNRGSGGHKGIDSINKTLKTTEYTRIKVGVCPVTPTGTPKKPAPEKILTFIIGAFKPEEMSLLKKVAKEIAQAIQMMRIEGRLSAMNSFN